MKNLSLIVIGENQKEIDNNKDIEILYSNGNNIINDIKKVNTKYIAFIKEGDKTSSDYLDLLVKKSKESFDCCFINYNVKYDYKNNIKTNTNIEELKRNKPYYGEYIWAFIYDKEKLESLLQVVGTVLFNKKVDETFAVTTSIDKIIYLHYPDGKRLINDFQLVDSKKVEYYKNAIYIGEGANGTFNGYISWINNIGRCFGNNYKITIIYEEIKPTTLGSFIKKFNCVKRENNTEYVCDRLLVTYSTYYYPKNIFYLDQNYLFIHGNMSDYKNTRRYYDDLYSHYVAVSKIAAKKAEGYFPTNNIEYVLNPFKLDSSQLKPHLTLTSALRYSNIKRPERIEYLATILDELKIPYTWNVFTDKKENTNCNGLIFRKRIPNPLPYIEDSNYFVLLSDSEAMPYCIMEALSLNTKVIVTPLEAYDELRIKDGENGFIIPFEYFEEENKDKLIEKIKEIYKEKDKKIKYELDASLWDGYNNIFIK